MISRQADSGSAYELESTEQDSRRASNFPARPSASLGLSSRPPRTTRTLTFAARPGAAMHAQTATIVRRCMQRLSEPVHLPALRVAAAPGAAECQGNASSRGSVVKFR